MDFKMLRENAGISQKEVADELGYSSPQFVSNWERGIAFPPVQSFKRLAKLYKVSPKVLIEMKIDRTRAIIKRAFRTAF